MRTPDLTLPLSLAVTLAAAGAAGCWSDDRPIAWERERTVLGPIPLKSQIAYVDSALDRVTLLDLEADAPRLSLRSIGRRAILAVPSPDRHLLFVVTRGEEAISKGQIDEPPKLWVLDAQDPRAAPIGYAIGSPFDRIAVAPDNSLAVAYFSAAGPDAAGFFRNPNELAVIDLARPPGEDNPRLKTIRSFGAVPEGISLSPPMVVPNSEDPTPRTFGFILSADNLTVFDATHADRREVSIRLDLGGAPVIPREVVFAPNTASAYVRSDNAGDVLQVILEGIASADEIRAALDEVLGAG